MGKVAALKGGDADATPFTTVTVESISTALHELGYQRRGNEVRALKIITAPVKGVNSVKPVSDGL